MLKNILVWTAAIALSTFSGAAALGSITKSKMPLFALSLYPANGFAAENLSSDHLKSVIAQNRGEFPSEINAEEIKLARQAYRAEPVTPQAVAVLALGSAKNHEHELMRAALSLSRREQLITGWMIVDSRSREDIPGILKYYDTMLRTNSTAASVVLPIMTSALGNDNTVAPYANLLAKKPPWANQFWETIISKPNSLHNASRLRETLYEPDEHNKAYRDTDLIRALVYNQQFDEAQSLYRLLDSHKETELLIENSSFEVNPEYAPLDWQLFSTGEYGATVSDGTLVLSAIQNSGGLFARQLVKLPLRTLTMQVDLGTPIPESEKVYITLSCAEALKTPPLPIEIPIKRKIENINIINSRSGCSFYWLNIFGRASDSGGGIDVALESVFLS